MELCRGVHTTENKQKTTQIPIEFCILVMGVDLGLDHCQCERTKRVKLLIKDFIYHSGLY